MLKPTVRKFSESFVEEVLLTLISWTGLEKNLKMTDFQYDKGLTVFYATYIARFVKSSPNLHVKLCHICHKS